MSRKKIKMSNRNNKKTIHFVTGGPYHDRYIALTTGDTFAFKAKGMYDKYYNWHWIELTERG